MEYFLKKQSNVQTILLDKLFITGNGHNRFIKCNYVNDKLDFTQACHVKPSWEIKNVTIQWLHNNYEIVKNSILTDSQRQNIKDNIVF
ncbi:type II toxin-antitoxin system RnlB family antitoxin [Ureaplasma ceti]|uniref:type II toxin-antitoxin system RnlB family antitoxin n=1 Tax=Ureaplasma ceti TaxID=3119530 RepID=UPI00334280BE